MPTRELTNANLAKLPSLCYSLLEFNKPGARIAVIRAGEMGYFETDYDSAALPLDHVRTVVDRLNERLGVTSQQHEAMVVGSMFGFQVQGANPDCYAPIEQHG